MPRKSEGRKSDDRAPRKFEDRAPRKFEDRAPRKFEDRAPREFDNRAPREFDNRAPRGERSEGRRFEGERGPSAPRGEEGRSYARPKTSRFKRKFTGEGKAGAGGERSGQRPAKSRAAY